MAQAASEKDKGGDWADESFDPPADVAEVTKSMAKVKVDDKKPADESKKDAAAAAAAAEEEQPSYGIGLHPNDAKAEVDVSGGAGIYGSASTFEELGLSKQLLEGVYAAKFVRPSKIQAKALPIIMDKKRPDLVAQAHHGSGKTATFSLGMLSSVVEGNAWPQAVCVVPTRELAVQVCNVVNELAKFTKIRAFLAVPGSAREPVKHQIVVGTPGTILGKMKKGRKQEIDPRKLRMLVLDEADQMLAKDGMGELAMQVKRALKDARNLQILLFSATFADHVRSFALKFANNPVKIVVKRQELSLDGIAQFYFDCASQAEAYQLLLACYGLLELGQSIIFVQTVRGAKHLVEQMRKDKFSVSLLHGRMEPEDRDRVMEDFREGRTTVLVTTNVLARGIDVLQVTLVVNFSPPITRDNKPDPQTYIHRIGRSGRFGRKGVAVNFVYDDVSRSNLKAIAQHFNKDIALLPKDDMEQVAEVVQEKLNISEADMKEKMKASKERQAQRVAAAKKKADAEAPAKKKEKEPEKEKEKEKEKKEEATKE